MIGDLTAERQLLLTLARVVMARLSDRTSVDPRFANWTDQADYELIAAALDTVEDGRYRSIPHAREQIRLGGRTAAKKEGE